MTRLAEILVERKILDQSELDSFVEQNPECRSEHAFYQKLLAEGVVPEAGLIRAGATVYAMEHLLALDENILDSALIEKIPIAWARQHCVLPVMRNGEVGMLTSDPEAQDEEEYLSLVLGEEVVPILCPEEEVRRGIEQCYVSREGEREQVMAGLETDEEALEQRRRSESDMDLLNTVEDAPVTQLVNLILLEAVKREASDIHIEPYEDRLQVRYRIDGVLYEQQSPPKRLQQALVSRLKVMARLDIAEKRLPQDGMAKVRVGEREVDVRVSSVPVAEGERLVLRILSRESVLMPMDGLGMAPRLLDVFKGLLKQPQGIILVTGPTGSGKTTTLYSGLQQLDTQRANVITIEDPIEYQLEKISQIQVKPRIGLTFADGLRHILRQDPDVILVGEIRDRETAEIAIRSSLTGHLVLSTLHTNDAVSTPLRIIDMGIKPYLLSESLRAVLAQRLVRKLCPECKRESELTEEDRQLLGETANTLGFSSLYKANGCESCRDGFRGRLGLFEYLLVNDEVQTAIRREANLRQLNELASKYAMDTLWDDGIRKIGEGVTSLDEVARVLGRRVTDYRDQ